MRKDSGSVRLSPELAWAPGEEGAGSTAHGAQPRCRDPQGAPGENVALAEVLPEDGVLPPQGPETLQVPAKGFPLAGDRGAPRGHIALLLPLEVLHHRFCALRRQWGCFSATKDIRHSVERLYSGGWGAGQCGVRSLKI